MGRRLGKFDLGIFGIQNLIPIAAFHGIFEYSSNNIRIFKPKIFEYSVQNVIPNIFVFVLKRAFQKYSHSFSVQKKYWLRSGVYHYFAAV